MTQSQNPEIPTVYSTDWCPDCHRAKAYLNAKGIAFREVDLETTPEATELVIQHNQGKRIVPTFEIRGRFYGNPPLTELGRLLRDQ